MADVVVASPHLDDAVLSAWSVLARDPDVTVVTCFAGVPDSAEPSYAVRRAEDREVLRSLGCTAVHLEHDDGEYRESSAEDLVDVLVRSLEPIVRQCNELWLPMGIGRHPDHLLVRAAGLRLARELPTATRLYADLPYAARFGWPRWVEWNGRRPSRESRRAELQWIRAVTSTRLPPWRLQRRSVVLDDAERARKLLAVRGYHSQAEHLGYGSTGPAIDDRLLEREVWWELT